MAFRAGPGLLFLVSSNSFALAWQGSCFHFIRNARSLFTFISYVDSVDRLPELGIAGGKWADRFVSRGKCFLG
jgi:hypothetical protein